jgi:polyphosphate kinase
MQAPLVQRRPLTDVEQIEVVTVVGDHQDPSLKQLSVQVDVQPMVLARQAFERPDSREHFAAAPVVLAGVDEVCVQPERNVVQEQPAVDTPDVDALLEAVEGAEPGQRVLAIETEIAREVVARPERDADEREVAFEGDIRDGRERAVAARHAESVCLRSTREGIWIVSVVEDMTLDTSRLRRCDQLVRGRAVAPGPRVDDQIAAPVAGLSHRHDGHIPAVPKSGTRPDRVKKRPGDRIINRELSSLDLIQRVLDLAADPDQPLLERVRYCSIVSSVLDEFFMIRVAGLLDQARSGLMVRSADGRLPQQALREIRTRVLALTRAQGKLWTSDLCPTLATKGIEIGTVEDLSKRQRERLHRRFERDVFPVLTPLAVGPGQPFPFISPLSISLGLFVRNAQTGEERLARLKVPERLPRFMRLADDEPLVPLERVIAHFLPPLFAGMSIEERAFFRVTRDADFEVSDEADDLLEALQTELRRQPFGAVVRLEVSESMSSAMLAHLKEGLQIGDDQVYPVRGLIDMAELSEITELDRPELKYDPWLGVKPHPFGTTDPRALFGSIRRGDALVHLPYDSFAASVERFVDRAARDPKVSALKTTVYRTSDDSALAPALIAAADNGKQAVCLVELKARFDEQNNIQWSQRLEQAGVHVVHGFPRLKIHAKTTLVVRRDADGLRRYAHIGTGNYHADTARVYEDLGLFTADPDITADIADLFNYLTGFSEPQEFRKLLVAPFNLRAGIMAEIRATTKAAEAGAKSSIRIKANAVHDRQIIEALYAASGAGVQIEVVTRRMCGIRPGVKDMSEHIRVRSVLGRFLEHSRFFIFRRGKETRHFLGSADLLPRNLDHRIEVVAPIEAPELCRELDTIFAALVADNTQSWDLGADGSWVRARPPKGEKPRTAQSELMVRARSRARR